MNKTVILVGLNGRPSMRSVYRLLRGGILIDTEGGIRVYENNKAWLKQHTRTVIRTDDTKDSIVINWGMPTVRPYGATRIYNDSQGVSNSSNKARARQMMHSHGVRVPKPIDKFNYHSANYPLIWRPSYHNKGKQFVVLNFPLEVTEKNYLNSGYLSEFVDKDREFRVHVGGKKILAVSEKPPQKAKKWNEIKGQEFFQVFEWPTDVSRQAVAAVKAVGLDHGGVDVMLKGKKAYVLEINTAPTLYGCDFEIEAYREYFQSIINS